MPSLSPESESSIDATAADWLACRDRGLTRVEQDAYLEWLQADPRHGAAMARHQETLRRLMRLGEWQPGASREPNPDLFAPRRPAWRSRWRRWAPALGLAAALALLAWVDWPERRFGRTEVAPSPYLRVNERVALADSSLVELKDGSRVEERFTDSFRRVRLVGGEALFTVAHDPARPFVVEAGGVEVTALGTVFNVRLDAAAVDVLVTQGSVRVTTPGGGNDHLDVWSPAAVLSAGERTSVKLVAEEADPLPAPVPLIVAVSPEEIRAALQWQTPLLQFHETPLRVAVAEFNRHNPHRILLPDQRLGETRIGGSFRVDNVAGFLRAVEITLEAVAEPQGEHITLMRPGR
jgi:transmembrane sensor